MEDYILAPDGIAGVVTKSIGGYTQVWPSGDIGITSELTTSWVPGDEQLSKGANQIILWPVFSPGAGTTECQVKLEMAMSSSGPWYQEPYVIAQGAGKVTYIGMVRVVPSGYNIVMDIPFIADYVRISAKCVGTGSGSLLGINATIASVM